MKRKGVAISTAGKVLLTFQQNRRSDTQLEGEDHAALPGCRMLFRNASGTLLRFFISAGHM